MTDNVFSVEKEDTGNRIDKHISEQYPDISRSFIQKLVKEGQVQVNGIPVKANYKIAENDRITVMIPNPVEPAILPQDIPLDIIYEDSDIIVVNKPKGMVVHPAAGHYSNTLVNALLFHCTDLSGINGILRPGIVHRIDMNTTGSILVCKNDIAHSFIANQLKNHSINRRYRAIVMGNVTQEQGTVNGPIGRHPTDRKKMAVNHKNGKEAATHYKVLKHYKNYTYIECILETGRTHQIRVHMASIGYPLLGDDVYCNRKIAYSLQGQTLHAMTLGFIHPSLKQYMEFQAPLPTYFEKLLQILPQ